MKTSALLATALMLSACGGINEGVSRTSDPTPVRAIGEDRGRDHHDLAQMEAGIWVDPDGCQHWIIDDGLEGYIDARRDPVSGLPVCVEGLERGAILGDAGEPEAGLRDRVPRQR